MLPTWAASCWAVSLASASFQAWPYLGLSWYPEHVGLRLEETRSIWPGRGSWFQLARALRFKNYPDELILYREWVERTPGLGRKIQASLPLIMSDVIWRGKRGLGSANCISLAELQRGERIQREGTGNAVSG